MIEKKSVYGDREQWIGYERLSLVDGTTLAVETITTVIEPTKDLAMKAFDQKFRLWERGQVGFLCWIDLPRAYRDLKGWYATCRVAATDDVRFQDAEQIAPREPHKAKFPMMTLDEMLVRTNG